MKTKTDIKKINNNCNAIVATINSAIMVERQSRLINGDSSYINSLSSNDSNLFDTVLSYPIEANTALGGWSKTGEHQYTFYSTKDIIFEYNNQNGNFKCTSNCSLLY